MQMFSISRCFRLIIVYLVKLKAGINIDYNHAADVHCTYLHAGNF